MSSDSLGEKYKKEELQNHIFNTPDTYVGGCDLIVESLPYVNEEAKKAIKNNFLNAKRDADGLQFISVQKSPDHNSLDGFWMLRDIGDL